ncbi:Serine-pyruvate aminotransferase [subsurface metagenome]
MTDIRAIGKIVAEFPDTVLVVDAVSSLGAVSCRTDEWNLDVVITGSQKALMLPPGLSFLSISEKAGKKIESSKLPRYYFDLKKYRKSLDKFDFPFTPAVSLILGLKKSLSLIREEGLEEVLKRHQVLAEATRAAVKAMGLELLAEKPVNALTAVKVPEGIDGNELTKMLKEKYGINFAGGQAQLKGKIFRIAHLGYFDKLDIILAISALEMALHQLGYKFELGAGIKAAEEILTKGVQRNKI